jgi:predicted nucleic acid binding AN1-type Zn finger protein
MAEILNQESKLGTVIGEKKSSIGRCNIDGCTKKLGIMPFICRCQKEFCAKHRMPETHECTFNYMTFGREELLKKNQKIDFVKVEKI